MESDGQQGFWDKDFWSFQKCQVEFLKGIYLFFHNLFRVLVEMKLTYWCYILYVWLSFSNLLIVVIVCLCVSTMNAVQVKYKRKTFKNVTTFTLVSQNWLPLSRSYLEEYLNIYDAQALLYTPWCLVCHILGNNDYISLQEKETGVLTTNGLPRFPVRDRANSHVQKSLHSTAIAS